MALGAKTTEGKFLMRDVQPLSAYQSGSAASLVRSTLVLALLWGIPMTMFMLRTNQGSVRFVVTISAIGALLFGSLVTMLARFATRQLTLQVYHGIWPIVPAAPPGEYEARLMCRMKRGGLSVGGHLYVGPDAWVFVPHTRNGPFYRKPVRWEQPAALSLAAEDNRLVVSDSTRRTQFVVPNAAEVVASLRATA